MSGRQAHTEREESFRTPLRGGGRWKEGGRRVSRGSLCLVSLTRNNSFVGDDSITYRDTELERSRDGAREEQEQGPS